MNRTAPLDQYTDLRALLHGEVKARRGWSQAEFCRRSKSHDPKGRGIPTATLNSLWTRHRKSPDDATLDLIAATLGTSIEALKIAAGLRPADPRDETTRSLAALVVGIVNRLDESGVCLMAALGRELLEQGHEAGRTNWVTWVPPEGHIAF